MLALCCTALLGGDSGARGFAPGAWSGLPQAPGRAAPARASVEEAGLEPGVMERPVSNDMPKRWAKVHDCDRPVRWREEHDEEDCKIYRDEQAREQRGGGAADSAGGGSKPYKYAGVNSKPGYTDLVPKLVTMEEFLKANAESSARGHLMVVKFYSKRCRACLRIAAKYRRLAIKHRGVIDCYEAELYASQDLLEKLDVSQVPSVQIFDGDGVTRLAHCRCNPNEFDMVENKVQSAINLIRSRGGLLKRISERLEPRLAPNGEAPAGEAPADEAPADEAPAQ